MQPLDGNDKKIIKRTRYSKDLTDIENIDHSISVAATMLVLIGVIMVFSSSYFEASGSGGRPFFYYFQKQAVAAVMGFCAMFAVSYFRYQLFMRMTSIFYVAANALLVYVYFFTEGAKRWLTIPGTTFSFQPSELAKVAIVMLLSAIIGTNRDILKKWGGFIYLSVIAVIPVALIALADLGTAIVAAVIGFGIIFVASPHILRFILAGSIGAGGFAAYIMFGADFRPDRITAWLDPFSYPRTIGYQIIQSLYAIGSGGFLGLGPGQSRQKMGFIPEAHNDIIFSVICEELGLFGGVIILIFFAIIIVRGIKVALNAVDAFGSMLASGIVLMIGFQAIVNVAVVTNSIPNTGVTLPFISYGGTSLTVTMFMVGVLLNISRQSKPKEDYL